MFSEQQSSKRKYQSGDRLQGHAPKSKDVQYFPTLLFPAILAFMLALFDSGVGGLSVLSQVRKVYKGPLLYLGDTARAPYGNRPKEEIVVFTKEILRLAKARGATYFVSACNSISGHMTDEMLKDVSIDRSHFIDMGTATLSHLSSLPQGDILVVATQATIDSHLYKDMFKDFDGYREHALPFLAGAIERGDEEGVESSLEELASKEKNSQGRAIFLGCTHYPLALSSFKKVWPDALYVDPAVFVREEVRRRFPCDEGLSRVSVLLSKESTIFFTLYKRFFDEVPHIEIVDFSLF